MSSKKKDNNNSNYHLCKSKAVDISYFMQSINCTKSFLGKEGIENEVLNHEMDPFGLSLADDIIISHIL